MVIGTFFVKGIFLEEIMFIVARHFERSEA